MTPIEIIALIVIIFSATKIIILLIKPKAWMNFAKSIYSNAGLAKVIGFVLAGIVLYYLISSGMTIVQILAVTAFVAALLIVRLASEVDDLLKKYDARTRRGTLMRDFWFYTLIWMLLLIWGVKELFF